jgi:toxin-antitoxin system PIN domain toxin
VTPDVNVLVAAFRPEHSHHVAARAWLKAALEDCATGGSIELLPMVAAGFVRIVTNRKAFPRAESASAALAFIRRILGVPGATMLRLGPEWSVFEKLCVDRELSGPDIADGWIAAAVKANGLRLVTFDTDFADLLDPLECLLLQPRPGVQEPRGSYVVRRMTRKRAA